MYASATPAAGREASINEGWGRCRAESLDLILYMAFEVVQNRLPSTLLLFDGMGVFCIEFHLDFDACQTASIGAVTVVSTRIFMRGLRGVSRIGNCRVF